MENERCRRWKAMILSVSLAVMFLLFQVRAEAASMQDVVALVGAFNSSGEGTAIHSGFILDTGQGLVLVTASNNQWALAETITVVTATGDGTASPAVSDDLAGVALLSVSGNMAGCPLEATAGITTMSEGDTLICLGIDMTSSAQTISELCLVKETTLAGFSETDGYTFALTSDEMDSMMAGGPVFNNNGNLVGVLSARGAVLPIEYIVNSVSGSGSQQETEGGYDRETSQGGSGGENGGTRDGNSGGSSGGYDSLSSVVPIFSLYFISVFFGALIVFVVCLVVYQNQESRKKAAGQDEFDDIYKYLGGFGTEDGGGSTGSAVEGLGGYFRGRRLTISDRPVTIGRDPARCSAVYPQNTKGVSGLHCRLSCSGGEIVLMDCGSTYGTYFGDGKKLSPNTPYKLRRGDTFYLAEPQNTFRVI